jgi:hypothetical protein
LVTPTEKEDTIVFIGHNNSKCYAERNATLFKMEQLFNFKIIPPEMRTWEEYIRTLSKYRFVLSPVGNGNIFTFRFYESLLVHSIPIHQVKSNTLQYYDIEAKFDDCIYFEQVEELEEKLDNFNLPQSYNEIWLEDQLEVLLKADNLL